MDPEKPRRGLKNLESLIQDGEGPGIGGFKAQTSNGTATWKGTGWNWSPPYTSESVEPKPIWPKGRNNRTGE